MIQPSNLVKTLILNRIARKYREYGMEERDITGYTKRLSEFSCHKLYKMSTPKRIKKHIEELRYIDEYFKNLAE